MTYQVGKGLDEYIEKLGNLEFESEQIIGKAIYKGADVIADAIKESINSLPRSACTEVEKQGLQSGFGIAKMRNDDGYFNVKAGFDGYNNDKTKKWPKGKPNAMIARSIENGTSWKSKHPFIGPAVKAAKQRAEKAMQDEFDKNMKQIMG